MSTMQDKFPDQIVPFSPSSEWGGVDDGVESRDLTLRQLVRVFRKRKSVVYGVGAICVIAALALSLTMRPYYASTATIEIERDQTNPMESSLGEVAGSLGGMSDSKVEIETEVAVLQSDDLALETMEKTHYEQMEYPYSLHWFGMGERPAVEKGLPLDRAPVTRKRLLERFSKNLHVKENEGTRLIQITIEDPDPKFAAELAATMINLYINDRLERRNSSTLQATQWMDTEIEGMKKQVDQTQNALIDFQQKSGLLALPSSTTPSLEGGMATSGTSGLAIRSPELDRFAQLNQSLVAAETDRIAKEAIYRVAQAGDPEALAQMGESLSTASPGAGTQETGMFSDLVNLRQQEVAINLQIASVQRVYGPKNPHMIDLGRELSTVHNQMQVEVKRIVNRAHLDFEMARKTEDSIRGQYDSELKSAYSANDAQVHLAILQEEADAMRMLYEDLHTKLLEAKLQIGMKAANIGMISRALPQAKPVRPLPALYTMIAIPVGLLLGVAGAFVMENMDDTFATNQEIEEQLGVPVLASIPDFGSLSARDSNAGASQPGRPTPPASLVNSWLIRAPRSSVSEAYRALRTSLLLSQPGSPPRVIVVSSSLPAEGKSTTVYNLAASFALMGKKVIVIDADLRRPTIQRFVTQPVKGGLSNLLTISGDQQDYQVQDPDIPHLYLLTAGPIPPNPSELLISSAFDRVLDRFSKEFDFVIIDSPPTMLVSDAAILSRKPEVDGVLLIARFRSTTRSALRRTAQTLKRNKASVLGVVLNAVDTSSSEYYYEQGYYYKQGKGYYGETQE